jgi:succinyl-CoA synthetase alpha subunit
MLAPSFPGGDDTAQAKLDVMDACGIKTTKNPSEMAKLLKAML